MAEDFNPYHAWLGIQPDGQPIDYYRLLGVARFESNLDVISNAADAKMAFVRGFQIGARAALSQKILNELAAAKGCLLVPAKKVSYDQLLKAKLDAGQSPATGAPAAQTKPAAPLKTAGPLNPLPQAKPLAADGPAQPSQMPDFNSLVVSQAKASNAPKTQKKIPAWIPFAAGGGVLAILAIVGILVVSGSFQKPKAVVVRNESKRDNKAPASTPEANVTPVPEPSLPNQTIPEPQVAEPSTVVPGPTTSPVETTPRPAVPDPNVTTNVVAAGTSLTSPVNLLKSLDVPSNLRKGTAQLVNGELLLGRAAPNFLSQVALPQSVPAEYDVAIQVTHEEGEGSICLGVVFDGFPTVAFVDSGKAEAIGSGYAQIEKINSLVLKNGRVLTKNKSGEIVVKVRKGVISTYYDQQLVCTWNRNGQVISLHARYDVSNPPELFLASWGSVYRIHKAELRPPSPDVVVASANSATPATSPATVKKLPVLATSRVQPKGSGYYFRFRGKQYIELERPEELTANAGPRTYEAWVRVLEPRPDNCFFGAAIAGHEQFNGWRFAIGRDEDRFRVQARTTKNANTVIFWQSAPFAELSPQWHHVALTIDPQNNYWLFLDGLRRARAPWHESMALTAKGFWIGTHPSITHETASSLDVCEFRISEGIKYTGTTYTPPTHFELESQTIVLLDFSADAGATITDLSGRNHHGRITGAGRIPFSGNPAQAEGMPSNPSRMDIIKLAPPDAETRAKKLEEVKSVFGDDITKAKKPDEKVAVAQKLLQESRKLNDDPAALYVMLDQARLLAAEAGQLNLAMSTVNELQTRFEIDANALKLETLKKTIVPASANEGKKQFVEAAIALAKATVEIGQFETATAALEVAQTAALRAKLGDLGKSCAELKLDINRQRKLFEEIQTAEDVLKGDASDTAANLKVGRYYAFYRKDWKRGLKLLSKGGDDPLAKGAQLDLAAGDQAESQVKAAEAWEKAAENADRTEKTALYRRAHLWYNAALPTLTGLTKVKAQQRFDAIAEMPGIAPELHALTSVTNAAGVTSDAYSGMVGRVMIGSKDLGVLVRYEPGRPISQQKLERLSQEVKAGNRQQLTIQLIGMFSLPEKMFVMGQVSAGNVDGTAEMRIGGRPFCAANKGATEGQTSSFPLGDHELTVALNGDTTGARFSLSHADGTSRVIQPYYTTEMLEKLRRQASKTSKPREINLCD